MAHHFDPRQDNPPPLPYPPENPVLSPVRSGPFAKRSSAISSLASNYDHNDAKLESIQTSLQTVAEDVKTTLHEFNSLAHRSRDNGEQLQLLMTEIRGVREDDGVSQKLTGLAQLDRLEELKRLDKLANIPPKDFFSSLEQQIASSSLSSDQMATLRKQNSSLEHQVGLILKQLSTQSGANDLAAFDQKLGAIAKDVATTKDIKAQLANVVTLDELSSQLAKLATADKPQLPEGLETQLASLATAEQLKTHLGKLATCEQIESQLSELATAEQIKSQLGKLSTAEQIESQLAELATVEQIKAQLAKLATTEQVKSHLAELATANQLKEHLSGLATTEHIKSHLSGLATADQLKSQYATTEEIKRSLANLATVEHLKSHLSNVATIDDIKSLSSSSNTPTELLATLATAKDQHLTLEKMETLASAESIDHLEALVKSLDVKSQLETLATSSDVDSVNSRLQTLVDASENTKTNLVAVTDKVTSTSQETLDKLNTLDEIKSQLHSLDKLQDLDNVKLQLQTLASANVSPDTLASVDKQLTQLRETHFVELQGEVRAVQDHMLAMHKSALQDLAEVGELRARHTSIEALRSEEAELRERVAALQKQETDLVANTAALKAESKQYLERLEDAEVRYSRLETSIRDMTLAKYKGVLGSSTLAILSTNQKENVPRQPSQEISMPKRQLRTVSLMDRRP